MEKKVSSTGMYETTYSGDVFVGKLSTPTKIGLTDQTKVALLEYLTESDDFHKLVCDITGVERKQVKASPELEKLKEEYSHMRESYEHEKKQRNDLLRKWREETVKRMKMQTTLQESCSHHNNMMNRIKDLLKEVDMPSVKHTIEALKSERANGKLLAEENEQCRGEYDRLKLSYDKVCEEKKNLLSNYNYLNEKNKSKDKEYEVLQALYSDVLLTNTKLTKEKEKAERAKSETEKMYKTDFEYLNKCNQNQAKTITKQMNELLEVRTELVEQKELVKKHMSKSEKLQAKLDKASKRYGELIKTISDRAIKSI